VGGMAIRNIPRLDCRLQGSFEQRMIMAVSIELGKKLDKDYEGKSLKEILDAPPSALAGLTEKHDELLAGMGIKTVKDLGSNKYFALAGVLVALSNHTD
jgi:hypothetical protein